MFGNCTENKLNVNQESETTECKHEINLFHYLKHKRNKYEEMADYSNNSVKLLKFTGFFFLTLL